MRRSKRNFGFALAKKCSDGNIAIDFSFATRKVFPSQNIYPKIMKEEKLMAYAKIQTLAKEGL
jgi:hypothetical protein